ncbi:DUF397 domain-containing protein [Streptomyces albus]|uniref:DUF397 domain-containing protein n=1 Tax=Streptomyces albus TaxID=1888 RepID=UPI00099C283D|nr:DUF397 domain-containing protein [Streptomyces albus]
MAPSPSSEDNSAPRWFKSTHSTNDGPDCVEVAAIPGAVLVHDSKDPQGPCLVSSPTSWGDFVCFASRR